VLFLGIVLCGLLFNKYLYAALFLLMTAGMMYEFYRMTLEDHYKASQAVSIVSGLVMFCLVFSIVALHVPAKFASLAFVPLIAVMILSLYVRDKSELHRFSNLYTGFLYIAVPLSLSNFIVFNKSGEFSGILMLCFFCIIWASDIGAYCFGLLFGRNGRKLFPGISPKKSWAGVWGGLATAVACAVILHFTGLLAYPLFHCIALSVVMNVAGVYGDLFESQWKRIHGLKDSGNIIPGHGGLLDRFDSTLFAIPIGVVYLVVTGLL